MSLGLSKNNDFGGAIVQYQYVLRGTVNLLYVLKNLDMLQGTAKICLFWDFWLTLLYRLLNRRWMTSGIAEIYQPHLKFAPKYVMVAFAGGFFVHYTSSVI